MLNYQILSEPKPTFSETEKEILYENMSQIVQLQFIAENEGLLAMEEFGEELPALTYPDKFLKDAISLIVNGTDPDCVNDLLCMEICHMGVKSFDAYVCFVLLKGIQDVQNGESLHIVKEHILHCLPVQYREMFRKKLDDVEQYLRTERKQKLLEELPKYFPHKAPLILLHQVNEISKKLVAMAPRQVHYILCKLTTIELAILTIYLSEDARNILFQFTNDEMRGDIIEGMQNYYPEESALVVFEKVHRVIKAVDEKITEELNDFQDYDDSSDICYNNFTDGNIEMLIELVRDGLLPVDVAILKAETIGLSASEFTTLLEKRKTTTSDE